MSISDNWKNLSRWELVFMVVIVSDIVIVTINIIASLVLHNKIIWNYAFIGMIDALVVPFISAPFVIYLFNEENRRAAEATKVAKARLAEAEVIVQESIAKHKQVEQEQRDLAELKIRFFDNVSKDIKHPIETIMYNSHMVMDQISNKAFDFEDPRKVPPSEMKEDRQSYASQKRRMEAAQMALHTVNELDEPVSKLMATAESLNNKIHNVVELAAMETGMIHWQSISVDLSDVLRKAIENVQPYLNAKRLTIKAGPVACEPFEGDLNRLIQAVTNVLEFSIKLTDRGLLTYTIAAERGMMTCAIEDSGGAMPNYIQERVFGSGNAQPEGDEVDTEPGLNLARLILAQHHGSLSARRKEDDTGNYYLITLPYDSDDQVIVKRSSR